jgi:hypothetical protein
LFPADLLLSRSRKCPANLIIRRSQIREAAAGGAAGLALHESGHLVADWAFEEKVVVKKVGWKGVPFFALSHAPTCRPAGVHRFFSRVLVAVPL